MAASLSTWQCGKVTQPLVDAEVPDAEIPDAEVPDAPTAACDTSQPFGAPVPIAEVNTAADDDGGWLASDRLTIYFNSNRAGGLGGSDIYYATRTDVDTPFGAPVLMPNINTAAGESGPIVTDDGLTIFFSRRDANGWNIYIATRSNTATAFANPELALNVNDSSADDFVTYINASGTTLYLSSTRSGDWDTYRATRTSPSLPFGPPTPIGELNVAEVEDYGTVLTGDELTVFFESARPGTMGCYDIFVATRSTVLDGFGTPSMVSELSTPDCEYPTWVSPDGCDLMLGYNPADGDIDIMVASRPR